MRDEFETILKNEMRIIVLKLRADLHLTQSQMAEALYMSTRSYADIESGASACGALTVVLLIMMLPRPNEFLESLKLSFEKAECEEEAIV